MRRPGGLLALLQALALWPAWIGFVALDRMLRLTPSAQAGDLWLFRALALVIVSMALVAHVGRAPRGLVPTAERGVGPLVPLIALGLLLAPPGLRVPDAEFLLVGVGASALAGVLHLGLAAVVYRWAGGVLGGSPERPELQSAHCRYLLAEWPAGCAAGETLYLPDLTLTAAGNGPYRQGRTLGHAPTVIRDRDGRLVEKLVRNGVLLEAWALATLAWLIATGGL